MKSSIIKDLQTSMNVSADGEGRGKTQLLRPSPNSAKFEKIGESSCSSKLKSLKKIAATNYLFSLVYELALPFDSSRRSGSFPSDFLVGFRGFDSFQFRHLVAASRTAFYFKRKDRNPASRIYPRESALRRSLVWQ